ncbi:hypothetical protein N7532_011416 [Penicillium argentinense]|uniref:Kelch repeat protein n=1 Tax=Penicillium argentinense TaxID=1131581 RepID=A0A9W9EID5_9EURO|nr:uncharacterized protein N7532_011416 [Penicillium argentinense]KAJ5082373.1 hypothetical protein N7532_011416 [Penicillium argentinense]
MWWFIATVLIFSDGAIGASNSSTLSIDPIKNFCQRLWHQSVVKDDVLYIDGGIEVFIPYNNHGNPEQGDPILGLNTYMVMVPMNGSWNWDTNITVTAVNKTVNSETGALPPSNIRGALYAGAQDDSNVYMYGGTVSYANQTFPGFMFSTAPTYSLWSVDPTGHTWNQFDVSLDVPFRPAGGAYAEATGRGMAFYLNGFLDNGSSPDYQYYEDFRTYVPGLIVLNTTTQEAKNLSTSSLNNYPRAMGGLVYLPKIGTEGILVSMGGVTKPVTNSALSDMGTYVSTSNSRLEGAINSHPASLQVPFDSVDFLDIASIDGGNSDGTWYTQTTTGDIPAPRTDFCLVTVSAPDNSSHNIYLYGGKGEKDTYDQTYVLSIPSFTWIKLMEGASSSLRTYVAILNLNNSKWGKVFNYHAGAYTLPSKITDVIGGSAMGNATLTEPATGFSNEKVTTYFSQLGDSGSDSGSHMSGGTIAGAAIGSVAGAAVLVAGLIYVLIIRRRKRKAANRHPGIPEAPPDPISARFSRAIFRNSGRKVELGSQRPEVHEMDTSPQAFELPVRTSRDSRGLEEKKD